MVLRVIALAGLALVTTVAQVTLGNRDVYTKIRSRWYDELDRVSAC